MTEQKLSFFLEAHSAISAKNSRKNIMLMVFGFLVFTLSTMMGVRDANELSWSEIINTLAFISESTTIPILVDGDTGYGNFKQREEFL